MATRGKKVEIYYTSQGTTTGIDASALVFDGKNLNIYTHNKTFKGTDTTYDVFGPSGSNASSGLVPAPSSTAGSSKFLREDATWADLNLVNPYVGPTNDLDASVGYINSTPGVGQTNKFFRSDGTWVSITKSTVGLNNVDNTSDASKTVAAAGKATNLAAGAAGSIPYQSASNTTAFLTAGSNGQVLAYDSANNKPYWKDDNNTWKAANTSQEGYVPQLATGGGTIATQASEYVLTFKNGTDTAPTWRLLPSNAFNYEANTWRGVSGNGTSIGNNALNIKSGNGISVSVSNGDITITNSAPDVNHNTDANVAQSNSDSGQESPILLKNGTGTGNITSGTIFADGVTVNPSTNSLSISGNLTVTGTASFSNNVTASGGIKLGASDLNFSGSDPGDIVWFNGSGSETERLWSQNGGGSLNYRTNAGTTYSLVHTGNISSQSVNYANSAGSASSATTASKATNLLPENTPHYFRDPGTSGWTGGMFWGSSGSEAMSFIVRNAGTRFQFVGNSDISTWKSDTWASVTPYLTISSSGISTPGTVTATSFSGSIAWSSITGKPFNWSGQSGQPSWLWGSNDGSNYYVWNPSNFSVNYANSAGSVAWSNVSGRPSIGGYWNTVPQIGGDGVMEVGKYIDFHSSSGDSSDYCFRLEANSGSLTGSGNFYSNSDRRLKKNIQEIGRQCLGNLFNDSDKLLKKFTWKLSGKDSYGFIAQQLEGYIPEAVLTSVEGTKSVDYNAAYAKLFASLINEIKTLKNQVQTLLADK